MSKQLAFTPAEIEKMGKDPNLLRGDRKRLLFQALDESEEIELWAWMGKSPPIEETFDNISSAKCRAELLLSQGAEYVSLMITPWFMIQWGEL